MNEFSNVLIAVNEAEGPLLEGLKIAREGNCWATVLKVTAPYDGDIDLTGVRDVKGVINSRDDDEVARIRRLVYENDMSAKVMVEPGDVADTIIRVAAERKCDLIVMGARRNAGRLYRYLNGNLVNKVANGAHCTVMVVGASPESADKRAPLALDEPVPAY